ncbi:MAG: SDR family oxidoreductase [Calditrichia bacterium]
MDTNSVQLSGKSAIVTGGGSGIGKAITRMLVEEGVNVLIASRRAELLQQVSEEFNKIGNARVLHVQGDLRNKADIYHISEVARDNFASIDFLVNNSGLGVQSKIVDCTEEEWDAVLDTNLKGTFLMSKAVLPTMIAQRSGFILNIASQAAKYGYPNAGPYCASKFGVLGFGEALQQEVREYSIRVHTLMPGLVQVPPPQHSENRNGGVLQVEDLAETTRFLFKLPPHVKLENIGMFHL